MPTAACCSKAQWQFEVVAVAIKAHKAKPCGAMGTPYDRRVMPIRGKYGGSAGIPAIMERKRERTPQPRNAMIPAMSPTRPRIPATTSNKRDSAINRKFNE
ncbi:hypothetical protein E4U31_005998 [Claviceps sp. LM219 group G6]|nr:hypothetical protein E4U14_000545 [Claviceps sp. LM454 group G7]KAG6095142.1 hypothetical protein E4U31_005998 [Claviceps sp. LM219 group G6]